MISQRRKIPATQLAFVSGAVVTQELPTAYAVVGYDLFIRASLVVSGGSSSSVARSAARQWEFVDTLKLIANGGKVLKIWKGQELRQYMMAMRGTAPAASTLSGNLDAATYTPELHYHIPARVLRGAITPNDGRVLSAGFATWEEATTLPSWSYDELTLELTWGTAADFSDQSGNRTETLTVPTVELYEVYARSERLTAAQQDPRSYGTATVERKAFTVTAVDSEMLLELPRRAGFSITRILVAATTTAGLSDAVVNSLTVRANENVDLFKTMSWKSLRSVNKGDYALESALEAGYAWIDFADDQNLGDVLNTAEWNKLHVVADVLHPGTDAVNLIIEGIQS